MRVEIVPQLEDNYGYLIIADDGSAACVDPVEPDKIITAAAKCDAKLVVSLTTHMHWDHAGGNEKLAKLLPGLPILGGDGDNCPGCTGMVRHGETINVGSLVIRVIGTAGHTPGHVAFYVEGTPGAVFTGDCMFVAGCGNFNNGTPKMVFTAFERLAALPLDTTVWVGHEYTTSNLQFAAALEPENSDVAEKLEWAKGERAAGRPTIPSTISSELLTNPFLHFAKQEVIVQTGETDPIASFAAIRKFKDVWGKTKQIPRIPANI